METSRGWMIPAAVLACGLSLTACAEDSVAGGGNVVDETLLEFRLGDGPLSVDPVAMNRLVENGGAGPIRLRVISSTGDIMAEIRANSIEGLYSIALQRAKGAEKRWEDAHSAMKEFASTATDDQRREIRDILERGPGNTKGVTPR